MSDFAASILILLTVSPAMVVLGVLIARVTGQAFEDFLAERVFRSWQEVELNMVKTTPRP